VVVTANYTLSFDAVRAALRGRDVYILVLDTKGVNVWCAAGEGTFGTEELVRRVAAVNLRQVVAHRTLILPQLSASGVAAHEVALRCGFAVEYGPVRAADLPAYLDTRQVRPEMRRVRFGLRERAVLIPVELVYSLLPMAIAGVVLWLAGGWVVALSAPVTVLAGTALFPLLLPVLPTPNFSTKGFVLGAIAWALLAVALLVSPFAPPSLSARIAWVIVTGFGVPAGTAFLALNFTGATPITSRSGVAREIFRYVPVMAVMGLAFVLGVLGMLLIRILPG